MSDEPRSKYFRISEWDSPHPLAKPYPREWAETRWRTLANMLDVIRERLGQPVTVTPNGGYRCAEHNKAIGGAKSSQHQMGTAADIVVAKTSAKKVHHTILTLHREGSLPDLGGLGLYGTFVHVDTRVKPGGALARWSGVRSAENA